MCITPDPKDVESASLERPHALNPSRAPKIAPQEKCTQNLNQSHLVLPPTGS